jgi:outer membrane protein assembly factor BamB
VACAGDSVLEFNASTGAFVANLVDASYWFNSIGGIASDGTHVWVTNDGGGDGSVTELDATTGRLVKVLKARKYRFSIPGAIASDGTHVWVTNTSGSGSVTELKAATGRLVKVLKGAKYRFSIPGAIASDGAHAWVVNENGRGSVTELNATNGHLGAEGPQVRIQRTRRGRLGRHPRLGGQHRRRRLGDRVERCDRAPGEAAFEVKLSIRLPL